MPTPRDVLTGQFFRSLTVSGSDNRIAIGYDSKCYDPTATDQGTAADSIFRTWDIPPLADGTPGIVGIGTCGYNPSNGLSRMLGTLSTVLSHGWTVAFRAPGATWSNSATGVSPLHGVDFSIGSGSTRTACTANYSTTGMVQGWLAGTGIVNSLQSTASANPCACRGGDPWAGYQCAAKWIGMKPGADGPTDMRIQAIRQLANTGSLNSNNTQYVAGAYTTMDVSGAAAIVSYTVDCGTGWGVPGLVIVNPAVTASGTAYKFYSIGARVFRSDGSLVPLTGTSIALLSYTGHTPQDHAGILGLTGYTTPSPYFSSANMSTFLTEVSGRGSGNNAPNKIIIYTGHNYAAADVTDLQNIQSGAAATHSWRDVHIAIVNQYKTLCSALNGGTNPDILIVYAEAHTHNNGVSNNDAGFDLVCLDELRQVCASTGCELIDLFNRTWNGTTTDFNGATFANKRIMWQYMKGATAVATAGAGSGPIVNPSPDFVHNSKQGCDWLWRIVWDVGCNSVSKIGSISGSNPRPYITQPTRMRIR